MAGFILPKITDVPDARELGKVTIEYNEKTGTVEIVSSGFEWETHASCRESCMFAELWAMKMLELSIERTRLAPGSVTCSGTE